MWWQVFIKIFKIPKYIFISTVVFIVVLVATLLFPNIRLISAVVKSSQATLGEVLTLIFNLTGSLSSNLTVASAINITLIALLFGINVSIITYYLKNRKEMLQKSGLTYSTFGLISGILGIGCASCGSLIISFLGLGGALAFLPFGGQEFGFLGVILLVLSGYLMLKKMSNPNVC